MGWLDRISPGAAGRRRRGASDSRGADGGSLTTRRARGDYDAALAIWEPLAHAGVSRGRRTNRRLLCRRARRRARSATWLRAGCRLRPRPATRSARRNLAALYFKGEGVEQDYRTAAELYRAAAEAGDAPAQDMLSWMLLEGEVIAARHGEARRWADAAAEQGIAAVDDAARHDLPQCARRRARPARQPRWWREGAARGDADGQAMLGAALSSRRRCPARSRSRHSPGFSRARAGGSALAEPFFEAARAAA